MVRFHLHEVVRVVKILEKEAGIVGCRDCEVIVEWVQSSVLQDETVMEMDDGNGCTMLFNITELYA